MSKWWSCKRLGSGLFSLVTVLTAAGLLWASQGKETKASPDLLPFDTSDRLFVHRFLRPGQYMGISEIKPGMTGYGLSVFQGTKIEKFAVKVIGVVKKVLNGRDAILVRLSGPAMQKNNVIKGMSGSPVYIQGKLVGAISFGYDFSKEPIAGITPIVDMLDALADSGQTTVLPVHLSLRAPFSASDRISESTTNMATTSSGALHMVPLVSPLALVGFSSKAESFLTKYFSNIGIAVSSGASGALNPQLGKTVVSKVLPGSAVSVLLATGDFTVAATGTATACFGKKVLAFGHPFLSAGFVDFPMASAYVHQVLPSLAVSFKVASPLNIIGSFTADRPWACSALLGHSAKLVPVSCTVVDKTRHIQRAYKCSVVDHPDLTPELVAATAISAIDATHQSVGPYVACLETKIEAQGLEPMVRTDRFSTQASTSSLLEDTSKALQFGDPVGFFVRNTLSKIVNNEFQKSSIKSVKLKITLEDGHQTAKIDRVYLEKPFVAPGEEVKVQCVLKPFNKNLEVETLSVHLPRNIPDGHLLIGVTGGNDLERVKNRIGLSDPEPESLKEIGDKILQARRGDEINLVTVLPEQALLINGTKLINPPAHWVKVFFSNRHTKGPSIVKADLLTSKVTNWLLQGSHILTVEVRNPDKVAALSQPYLSASPATDDDIAITDQARKTVESSVKSKLANIQPPSGQASTPVIQTGQTTSSNKTSQTSSLVSTPATQDYPHTRSALVWRQETEGDFRQGNTEGVAVDSWGRISPSFKLAGEATIAPEVQIWSGAWASGHFYFSSSNQILRWRGTNSKPESVTRLDGVLIPAMTASSDGTLYAASVPPGHVWAIDTQEPNPKPRHLFKTHEIITSLAVDAKKNLFVGVAGSGKIYKVDKMGRSSVFFDSGQTHILSLFYADSDQQLYVGTGEKGTAFCINSQGQAKALYQTADHLVTGVVRNTKGDIYIATAAQGHLLRLLPSKEVQVLASSDAFYTLHYDSSLDEVFSGDAEGDVTMVRIEPVTGQPFFVPVCRSEQEAVLALASHDKHLFAGTANLAVLKAFEMKLTEKPVYYSQVKDAGRFAQWSHLRAFGAFNEVNEVLNSALRIETRTGDTVKPNETWSSWQAALYCKDKDDNGWTITSPAGRYFQFRLLWDTNSTNKLDNVDSTQLAIGRIDVAYLPGNTAPQFSTISLKPGNQLSGKQELSVVGNDVDSDNLLCSIEISADGGKTWNQLANKLRAKSMKKDFPGSSSSKNNKNENKGEASHLKFDDDKNAQLPKKIQKDQRDHSGIRPLKVKEVKKTLELNKQGRQDRPRHSPLASDTNNAKSSGQENSVYSETFTFSWDTTKQKDGSYVLKFLLDDSLSSPADSQQVANLRSVIVDNTQPEIEAIDWSKKEEGEFEIKVKAYDRASPIANATYKIDDGEPFALSVEPETADGLEARFIVPSLKIPSGMHKLEIKVSDRANNTACKAVTIK